MLARVRPALAPLGDVHVAGGVERHPDRLVERRGGGEAAVAEVVRRVAALAVDRSRVDAGAREGRDDAAREIDAPHAPAQVLDDEERLSRGVERDAFRVEEVRERRGATVAGGRGRAVACDGRDRAGRGVDAPDEVLARVGEVDVAGGVAHGVARGDHRRRDRGAAVAVAAPGEGVDAVEGGGGDGRNERGHHKHHGDDRRMPRHEENLHGRALATLVPRRAFGRRWLALLERPTPARFAAAFADAHGGSCPACERARGLEGAAMMRALYRRLPEGVRRCFRPLNLVDEVAALLPGGSRARIHGATEATRRLLRLGRVRFPLRRLAGPARGSGARLVCLVAADELSTLYWKSTLFAAP